MANTLRFKRGLASGIPTALAGEPLFTTDTFDLYIGNGTTNTRFQKYIASGTTSQLLRGDGSLLTMPIVLTSPANGEVLKYNGTTWVNSSDAGITGSGATGQVAYFTGSTTQAGSNNLFWDTTNLRLGIGTTTPNRKIQLVVSPSVTSDDGINIFNGTNRFIFTRTGSSYTYQGVPANAGMIYSETNISILSDGGYISMHNTGGERVRLFATGNFGIGTGATDSGEKLQVTGTMKVTGASSFGGQIVSTLANNTAIGGGQIYLNGLNGNRIDWVAAGVGEPTVTTRSVGTKLVLYPSVNATEVDFGLGISSNTLWFSVPNNFVSSFKWFGSTTRLMELTAGNLGLGVTPSAWSTSVKALQVGLSASVAARTGGSGFYFSDNLYMSSDPSTAPNGIYLYSAAAATYRIAAGQHQWYNAPSGTAGNAITFTQAMTLDASGNLAVGIATASSRLHVDAAAGAAHIRVSEAGTTRGFVGGANGIATSLNGYFMVRGEAGLVLSGNGNSSDLIIRPTTANVQIGAATDTGEKLQVTGTAKITAATTIGLTSTTGYSLVVQNSGATDATGIRLTSGGTDNGYFITAYNSVSKYASLQAGDNTAYRSIILNALGGNVGIGTNSVNASARFQVDSTTQGVLPPRMTTTQKVAIASPAAGLIVYDTTSNKLCCYNGTTWNDLF